MQKSKSSKSSKFDFNLSNRKYRMIGIELLIFFLIMVLSQIIASLWPMEEPLRTFNNDYWMYMLAAFIEVILICLMAFIGGIWFNQWRIDKNVRNTKNIEDMELEPIP